MSIFVQGIEPMYRLRHRNSVEANLGRMRSMCVWQRM